MHLQTLRITNNIPRYVNAYASVYVLLGKILIFFCQKELLFARAAVFNLYDAYLPCSLHFCYMYPYISIFMDLLHIIYNIQCFFCSPVIESQEFI